jgi:predicted transglutaminase-like cysteine proteinase
MLRGLIFLFIFIISAASADFIKIKPSNETEKNRINFLNKKIDSFVSLPQEKQLEEVNKLFNTFIKYTSDEKLYGKANHIAIVEETIKSMKGDCDDYTMAKAQALSYLGFKEQYVLYSTEKGVRHVKNIVKVNGVIYVLDNLNKKFRTITASELKRADMKMYSASLYLDAAKIKLVAFK